MKGLHMQNVSEKIRELIATAKPKLMNISPEMARKKPRPDSWSKQEILGHLIDSAANNHQRFVRGAQNLAMEFPIYNQNNWVQVQRYNDQNWHELVELFCYYNLHIGRVIEGLSRQVLKNPCSVGKEDSVTLEFVIKDYLAHLSHHLEKIME